MICKWILAEWRQLWEQEPAVLYKRPLSTTQVAEALSVTDQTVRNLIKDGRLPARRIGRNYQVPRTALAALERCRGCGGECLEREETA